MDYISTNEKGINNVMNNKAYSCFEGVSTDQGIISAKICLSLRRNKKQII